MRGPSGPVLQFQYQLFTNELIGLVNMAPVRRLGLPAKDVLAVKNSQGLLAHDGTS